MTETHTATTDLAAIERVTALIATGKLGDMSAALAVHRLRDHAQRDSAREAAAGEAFIGRAVPECADVTELGSAIVASIADAGGRIDWTAAAEVHRPCQTNPWCLRDDEHPDGCDVPGDDEILPPGRYHELEPAWAAQHHRFPEHPHHGQRWPAHDGSLWQYNLARKLWEPGTEPPTVRDQRLADILAELAAVVHAVEHLDADQ